MPDPNSAETIRPLAVVTGASSGIGYEFARLLAAEGHDLVVAADRPLAEAKQVFEALGANVVSVQADLATEPGVQTLYQSIGGRPVALLAANAGQGLANGFLDQAIEDVVHVINTNVVGTLRLAWLVGRDMREQGYGRILFTGSIAGLTPGTFQAVYNASKAFVDNFSFALRNELKDSGVSVTVLMPGLTDTDFFERAGLMDTKVGQDEHKMDPAKVARIGYDALMRGDGDVVAGFTNKVRAALAAVAPETFKAEQHRKMAEPEGGA